MNASTVALPTVEEIQLTNKFRVLFSSDDVSDEDRIYSVECDVAVLNGDKWESVIRGRVKWDGCADWGYGEQVIMHFCGRKDAELFVHVYDRCGEIMGGFD